VKSQAGSFDKNVKYLGVSKPLIFQIMGST